MIPFAGALPLGCNVTTERNVTVECTVTVECKRAVALPGLAGAVAYGPTEQDGTAVASAEAEQTKSLTLGPSKPKREMLGASI